MVLGKRLNAEPAILDNILARMQERAGIVNWYVDGSGWFWAKTATEAQPTRCLNKMDGVMIMSGTVKLRLVMWWLLSINDLSKHVNSQLRFCVS